MSDGTLNLPKRATAPATPATNRYKIYVDSNDDEVKYIDELGIVRTFKGDKGDTGDTGPVGPQGPQGIQGPAGPMNVEGFVDEPGTVTLPNTTTPTLVYSDSINISTTGNIFILVFMAIRPHSAGNDMEFRVDFDGVPLVPDYIEEHKDTNAAQSMWRMGLFKIDGVTAGNKDLELFFSKETTGGTAQLKTYRALLVRY